MLGPDVLVISLPATPVTPASQQTRSESSPEDTNVPLLQRYLQRNSQGDRWIEGDIPENVRPNHEHSVPVELKSPTEYFQIFFDAEVMNYIVEQTNLYCFQKHGKSADVSLSEVQGFFSIMIYMGICRLPAIEDYWSTATRVPKVADVMTYKRFQFLRSHIHFANNQEDPGTDRYRKIRPLLDMIRERCKSLEQEEENSVDECMVGYKGKLAGNLRQFQPDKPSSRFGFKLFVRAGTNGLTYDFIPYSGKITFDREHLTTEERALGVGAMAVISLCKSIPSPEKCTVTFDNFYTGIPLITYLKKNMNILSCGTIRKDRMDGCTFTADKELKKQGRGSCESKINKDGIVIVRWMDNKAVTLASNFVGVEPKSEVQRFDKISRSRIPVSCPWIIKKYNSTMGGVDLGNMFLALYKLPSRARRWYFPLFCYLIGLSLTNAWLLYKRDCEVLGVRQDIQCSKDFRLNVCAALAAGTQKARGRPSLNSSLSKAKVKKPMAERPADELRTDRLEHWP